MVVWQQLWGEVVDLQFIQEHDSERIIKIGPYLQELWGKMCVPHFLKHNVDMILYSYVFPASFKCFNAWFFCFCF